MCKHLYVFLLLTALLFVGCALSDEKAQPATDGADLYHHQVARQSANNKKNTTTNDPTPTESTQDNGAGNSKTKKAHPAKPQKVKGIGKGKKHAGAAVEISLDANDTLVAFEWTLSAITEVTPNGSIAAVSPDLSSLSWLNITADASKERWSAALPNGASLIIELLDVDSAINITFASQTVSLDVGEIKQTLIINSWPWSNPQNHLQLQLYLSDLSSNGSSIVNWTEDNRAVYLQLNSTNINGTDTSELYVEVLKWAELDSVTSPLQISASSDGLVTMSVPHFTATAVLDPRFSLILGVDPSQSGGSGGGDTYAASTGIPGIQPTTAPPTSSTSSDLSSTAPIVTDTNGNTITQIGPPQQQPGDTSTQPPVTSVRKSKHNKSSIPIIAGAIAGFFVIVSIVTVVILVALRENPAVRSLFHSARHRRNTITESVNVNSV